MDGGREAKTLIGREETHGRKFPGILEKFGLLISIVLAVLIGQWMWAESDWSTLALWPATVCGLPLVAILLAEMLGRIFQRIHVNGD